MAKQKHDIGHQKRQRALLEAAKRATSKSNYTQRAPRHQDDDQQDRRHD
ncbi:hypothetical protein [Paeniglutamicibacter antarcticus]|uniref:Uncharacterized protein n=1 Tax=Paeniglutamicibacter antarcticus TaxID=494023 RepID=A0ABP9TM12_9MICC